VFAAVVVGVADHRIRLQGGVMGGMGGGGVAVRAVDGGDLSAIPVVLVGLGVLVGEEVAGDARSEGEGHFGHGCLVFVLVLVLSLLLLFRIFHFFLAFLLFLPSFLDAWRNGGGGTLHLMLLLRARRAEEREGEAHRHY